MPRFSLQNITYPKIPEYLDHLEMFPDLVSSYGDLKDVQRPWAIEACRTNLQSGARILDLGGSRCEVATYLLKEFALTVVDPYDGSGNGPTNPDIYRKRHPGLEIVQGFLNKGTHLREFDAVISTSVVEHIAPKFHADTVGGIYESLKPGGYSIHAIDLTCSGVNGFYEKQKDLAASWLEAHDIECDVNKFVENALLDLETYFNPVTAYVRWKKDKPYEAYPWRKVTSLNFVAQKN